MYIVYNANTHSMQLGGWVYNLYNYHHQDIELSINPLPCQSFLALNHSQPPLSPAPDNYDLCHHR